MFRNRRTTLAVVLLTTISCIVLAVWVYNLPFVQDRIGWRVSELRAKIKYAFSPPEEAVFTPNPTVAAMVQATLDAYTPTSLPVTPTATIENHPTATITPTATPSPTPIPESVQLGGITHEYQKWNNCGPANLSMALSYWGWNGDQRDTAAILKPNQRDKNVMPSEMAAFVNEHTGLNAIVRVGGNLELLKRFIAAGFPVIIEKGFEGSGFDGWMGHYEALNGYDDARARFTAQDSYIMPDMPVPYDDMETYWQHFNYTYIVIYPPSGENTVMEILGPDADETFNVEHAAEIAAGEVYADDLREQFFAWFNRGANLVQLQDYAGAAAAYDNAFQVYAEIDPEETNLPWRVMWYMTGAYWAYYYTGRYYDVLNLADVTLNAISEQVLEESFYWRALAKEALGDTSGAINDLRTALSAHPDWEPALYQLDRLGAAP
jgi:hypothetical protein